MLRHRRVQSEGTDSPAATNSTASVAEKKLTSELTQIRKDAAEGGVSEEQYKACLLKAVNSTFGKQKKRNRRCFCLLFDCLWTVVLLFSGFALLVAYCEPLNFYLQRNLHSSAYDVNRVMRFAFLGVAPYLEAVGLDFTQLCLISNPFVNESVSCPCIKAMNVVDQKEEDGTLSLQALNDSHSIFVLRGLMPVDKEYGRQTLLQYVEQYKSLPSACVQTGDHPRGHQPYSLMDIVNEAKWKAIEEREGGWDVTWKECIEPNMKSLKTILPSFNFFPKGSEIDDTSVFSLSRRWGKGLANLAAELLQYDRLVLVVLRGRLRIKLYAHQRCMMYCPPTNTHVILSASDVLVLDRRYWSYSTHTWSDYAFTMTTTLQHQQ